jgi:hypothetical protein
LLESSLKYKPCPDKGNLIDELMGDGEVVNGEEAIEFVRVGISAHNGEQMFFWEYKVLDMTFDLYYVLVR